VATFCACMRWPISGTLCVCYGLVWWLVTYATDIWLSKRPVSEFSGIVFVHLCLKLVACLFSLARLLEINLIVAITAGNGLKLINASTRQQHSRQRAPFHFTSNSACFIREKDFCERGICI